MLPALRSLRSRFPSRDTLEVWFNVDVTPVAPASLAAPPAAVRDVASMGRDGICACLRAAAAARVPILPPPEPPAAGAGGGAARTRALFDALSLGWSGAGACDVVPYNAWCCDGMMRIIAPVVGGAARPTADAPLAVTFAVRAKLVLEDAEARRRLCALVAAARRVGASNVFLTVWRCRNERITGAQAAVLREWFPDCSIDDS